MCVVTWHVGVRRDLVRPVRTKQSIYDQRNTYCIQQREAYFDLRSLPSGETQVRKGVYVDHLSSAVWLNDIWIS